MGKDRFSTKPLMFKQSHFQSLLHRNFSSQNRADFDRFSDAVFLLLCEIHGFLYCLAHFDKTGIAKDVESRVKVSPSTVDLQK